VSDKDGSNDGFNCYIHLNIIKKCGGTFMMMMVVIVFNATFINILAISWWSVLLVEETGGPGENHRPVACHSQTLSHNVVSSTLRYERDSYSQL